MIKKLLLSFALIIGLSSANVQASEEYTIDTKGMHAFVTFKIKHLSFSLLEGHFNKFSGEFTYDENNPSNNKVNLRIKTKSIDTNHAERNKHLKSDSFFDTNKYPDATFVSSSWSDLGNGKAILKGNFTLRGITKEVSIDVTQIGAGDDPWGGYRRGFEGSTTLHLSDYNMKESKILGPLAEDIQVWLSIEGVRK